MIRIASDDVVGASTASADEEGPYSRRLLVFFICSLALFMATIDSSIVATALPSIGRSLHARINWLGWTITIYGFGQIVMLPLAGRISDQFGRKRIFLMCAVIFTVSSLACGLATNIYLLVALRFIQSLGGGGFVPSTYGIVADHFGRGRDRALGMFSAVFSIGAVTGPICGGFITEYWSWRVIFFVNLPIGLVLILLILRHIPVSRPSVPTRPDIVGIALLACTIVSGMVAITTLGGARVSPLSAQVLLPASFALVVGLGLVRHIRHAEEPVIPLVLLRGRNFAVMNLVNFLFGFAGFGVSALIPLYAENRYQLTTSAAGTVLAFQAIAMAIFSVVASVMLRRSGNRWPITLGCATVMIGLLGLSIAPRGLTPFWWVTVFAALGGLGIGCFSPASNAATVALAPDQVAAISGLRMLFFSSGSLLSVAVVTAAVARSSHAGIAQAHVYWILAPIIALVALLGLTIPHRHSENRSRSKDFLPTLATTQTSSSVPRVH